MSFIKIILLFVIIFIINCSGNKVSNYHGIKRLENKFNIIEINVTNKNDLIEIIGPPSTISEFDQNRWYYIERLKTNQSLIKLGNQKIKRNNVLVVELDSFGIVKHKKLLNLDNMNDIKYLNERTEKDFKNDSMIYSVLSSLREKINAPAKNRSK
tara:strand:- start:208 stop:672 length:465 start_codon:yes stop_codon:yes gene_type:complete